MSARAIQLSNQLGHAALAYTRSLLLWILAAIGYGIGWFIGILVRIVLWIVASFIAGYRVARQ